MKLEDLIRKYVAEESSEEEAKSDAEIEPQGQKHSHPTTRGEKVREKEAGGEINGRPAMRRKKAEADLVNGEQHS
jgi:hypothetical protein